MQRDSKSVPKSGGENRSPQPSLTNIPLVVANPWGTTRVHEHRLPHWQQGEAAQFVTWRIGDSLPKEKLETWRVERSVWIQRNPMSWDEATEREYYLLFHNRVEEWLDVGSGSCVLSGSPCRQIVEDALLHFDGERYILWAFAIMPNHVHTLFSLHAPHCLEKTLHSWKSYTAREINRLLERTGPFWQEDYWDRLIRSKAHFDRCVEYIRGNPAKARLATDQYTHYENVVVTSGYAGNP